MDDGEIWCQEGLLSQLLLEYLHGSAVYVEAEAMDWEDGAKGGYPTTSGGYTIWVWLTSPEPYGD